MNIEQIKTTLHRINPRTAIPAKSRKAELAALFEKAIATAKKSHFEIDQNYPTKTPRAKSKRAQGVVLMQRPEGVSTQELAAVLGWELSSARAFFHYDLRVSIDKKGKQQGLNIPFYRIGDRYFTKHKFPAKT